MISVKQQGNFDKTTSFLKSKDSKTFITKFNSFGAKGVAALKASTPKDTGKARDSWSYKIYNTNGFIKISWTNSELVDNTPLVILLQYGHGTRQGGYVQGLDFINPAMRSVFESIANEVWNQLPK